MATDYVPANPSGRTLEDLTNPKRDPAVPFDPTSPVGKRHTQAVFSTGRPYKCRFVSDATLATLSKREQWQFLYSTLRTCVDGDLGAGRRGAHFKGHTKMLRIEAQDPGSATESQRKALNRMRHDAFSRKTFFNTTVDSVLRSLDAWLETLVPEEVEPRHDVDAVRDAYRAHVAPDVVLLTEMQAEANADADRLTALLIREGLPTTSGTKLNFSGGSRHRRRRLLF